MLVKFVVNNREYGVKITTDDYDGVYTNNMQEELDTAKRIAKKAGETMRQYFDGNQQTQIKSDGSPVTIADKLINSMVIKELEAAFPEDGVIGEEESNSEYGMGRKWLCDPIDGTKAYTWGTPTAVFSLGLVVDGVPHMGVVYDPFLDRLYWSIRGGGSYCNDRLIQVSGLSLQTGIVAVSSDVPDMTRPKGMTQKLVANRVKLATFSGAIYKSLLVATGRFVGYVEAGVNAHDMAAVHVIVEEAGGRVTGLDGGALDYSRPFKGALVTNVVAHKELVNLL